MKKIMITGITGLLGSNLAYILKKDFYLYGISRSIFNMSGVESKQFDLQENNMLYQYIKEVRPDILIHAAAITNVDLCEESTELARISNSQTTKFIAEVCKEFAIKLIYISTDSVFDGTKDGLYSEYDKPNPINKYAETKLLGEKHVLENDNALVLRTNFYGFNYQDKYSFGEWILYSLQENKTINLFQDIFFSPILVNDIAPIIKKTVDKDMLGLYHMCGSEKISKYDFGIYLKKRFNISKGAIIKSSSETANFKAKRPKNMGMINDKLCKDLGITIKTPEESINEFYHLYCSDYRDKLKGIKKSSF